MLTTRKTTVAQRCRSTHTQLRPLSVLPHCYPILPMSDTTRKVSQSCSFQGQGHTLTGLFIYMQSKSDVISTQTK